MKHTLHRFTSAAVYLLCITCSQGKTPKRGDDPNPLESLVRQQAEAISQMQAELTSVKNQLAHVQSLIGTKAAFSARLSGHTQSFADETTIIFDLVDLNQGNGYDKLTGLFTAPVTGLYAFTLKIAHNPPGSIHVLLVKQGQEIAEVHASGDGVHPDRSSATVVVQLTASQRVWAQRETTQSNVTSVMAGYRSTFTGFLVRADQTA